MGAVSAKLKSLRGRGVRRCAMAEREISIAETGDVYPCQLLHEERFRAGNVRERSVGEIYSESPVFASMRQISVDTSGEMLCMRRAISVRRSLPSARFV